MCRYANKSNQFYAWVIGDPGYKKEYGKTGIRILVSVLNKYYGSDHEIILYEVAQYSICKPKIQVMSIKDLSNADINPTLCLQGISSASIFCQRKKK